MGWRKLFVPLYNHSNQKILDRHNAIIPCLDRIKPFATPHGLAGIFISYGATIGEGCTIFHQVTIGSNTLPGSRGRGCPTIGDNVYIGCGAKIIGNVRIGNNVRIGANCVVTQDVPDNATVVLEKPRVLVREEKQDNRFVWYEHMVAEQQ
jgi:serine O-acetyltransferase